MLPSFGNISDQSTMKSLLNQLLLSGMSIPQENQSIDYIRLKEELLRSGHDMRGTERADGSFSYQDSRDTSNQYDRHGLNKKRDYREERRDNLNQDRSSFFGGALERKDNRDFTDKWQQSGSLDNEWENRRHEIMGMRDRNRKMRHDDRDVDRDRGSSFFDSSLGSAPNILSSLQLPSTLGSNQESLHSNIVSDLWSSASDQASMGYMYGMEKNFLGSDSAAMRPIISAFDPPSQNTPKPTTSEKPDGCHTIFIGGLPDAISEEIITEIFSMCGAIQTIRISTGKLGKNFCHVRFVDPQSVEMALGYSGYRLAITSGGQTSTGRIHVDYAKSREDEKEYERLLRAKAREVRHQSEMEEQRVIFSERAAADLMKSIRSDSGFFEAFETLAQWLDRGECTRKNSSTFYNLLSSVNSHVRRLIKEKREHEEIVERQKQEQIQRVKLIMGQGTSILKVFNAASKKKCWDHFSKAQRRNIGEWHQQVEKAIKISAEEQMENRVEVGMDLDDEVDQLQSASQYSQLEEEISGEPEAKQQKFEEPSESESEKTQVEASQEAVEGNNQTPLDTAAKAALEAKDMKYRAQAAGLKALAEKNTSLMWQVEGYKNEILLLKQKFASVFQEKDLQIARLMTAVQALQNFLQHVNLNTNATKTADVEVEVTKGKSDFNLSTETAEESTVVVETNSSDIESTDMDDVESTEEDEEEEPETYKENEEDEVQNESNNTEDNTTTEAALNDDGIADGRHPNDKGETRKNEKTDEQTTSTGDSAERVDNIHEDNTEDDQKARVGKCPPSTDVVRLSSSQMVVVGILCSYLQICPYGATTDQVLTHVRRQVPGVTPEDLEKIMSSLPMLFSGDGLDFMNKTWKFNVLQM